MSEEITIGRVVHYKLVDKAGATICRPAIVVHVWPGYTYPGGTVQLVVFVDGSNDLAGAGDPPVRWQASVPHQLPGDDRPWQGSWHWHQECDA